MDKVLDWLLQEQPAEAHAIVHEHVSSGVVTTKMIYAACGRKGLIASWDRPPDGVEVDKCAACAKRIANGEYEECPPRDMGLLFKFDAPAADIKGEWSVVGSIHACCKRGPDGWLFSDFFFVDGESGFQYPPDSTWSSYPGGTREALLGLAKAFLEAAKIGLKQA